MAAASPTSEATTSVNSYEKYVEHHHCAIANAPPVTSAAGHAWTSPRLPSMIIMRKKGTAIAKNGAWWPTTAPMCAGSRPVRLPAVVIGMATAPNATGAVFAMRHTTAVLSGLSPRASTIVAVMATGAPNPARASRRPPKQNAMSMAWMRMSPPPIASKIERRSLKRPEMTVTR